MRFVTQVVDLVLPENEGDSPYVMLAAQPPQQPVTGVAEHVGPVNDWVVLATRIEKAGEPGAWSSAERAQYAPVPLFRYQIASEDPSGVLQLGLQVGSFIPAVFAVVGRDIVVYTLIGGVYRRTDGKPGCECWLGFAARLN